MALPENKCPADFDEVNGWTNNFNQSEKDQEWQRRMLEIQGAIAVASIGQVIIGNTGGPRIARKFVPKNLRAIRNKNRAIARNHTNFTINSSPFGTKKFIALY